jgi:hypothetical protein
MMINNWRMRCYFCKNTSIEDSSSSFESFICVSKGKKTVGEGYVVMKYQRMYMIDLF